MPSDFPFVIDRIALTENWSLHLPFACKTRMENGAIVLWRPGFTIWLNAWGNDSGESITDRKAHFAETASPDKFDEREHEKAGRLYYSYRLAEESDDERVPALYAFSFSNDGHLQLSFYFDSETDAELAYNILASANSDPATLPDHRVYSQLCFATNMIMKQGHPVTYMYREEPDNADDSGWRFFSGHESQEYVDDPSNTQVYPVAFVAQSTPDIVPHLLAPAGSQLEHNGKQFVPV
jgi:hypothetical protein